MTSIGWFEARGALILALASMTTACIPSQHRETIHLTYDQPNMQLLNIDSHAQQKGGVVVEADGEDFVVEEALREQCRMHEKGSGAGATLLALGSQAKYEVSNQPVVYVQRAPRFLVKVTNRTNQVLKLDGTVVRIRANETDLTLHKESYGVFSDGVLAPGQQSQYPVRVELKEGEKLSPGTNVHLGIYGLGTELDAAGGVSKRDNFEWTFVYNVEDKAKDVPVPVTVVTMNMKQAADRGCY